MRIPIKAAKEICNKYGYTHVIIFAYKPELQHITTFGKSIENCAEAADFGNRLKNLLKWPESLRVQPSRVRKLQERIKYLENRVEQLEDIITKDKG